MSMSSSPIGKSSPSRSPEIALRPPTIADHAEVERLRAAAAADLTHDEVKPIQTDFHFFVKEHMADYRKLAEEEVRKSQNPDDLDSNKKVDPMMVNSNLNTRMAKAWEDLKKEQHDLYLVKEEKDRRRFMDEDEVASRHCATLTARGKSPKNTEKSDFKGGRKEERQQSETESATSPDRDSYSPSRKKEEDEEEKGEGDDSKRSDENQTVEVERAKRRGSPLAGEKQEETHESPTKRNRKAKEATA
jgi:hypothetical protein